MLAPISPLLLCLPAVLVLIACAGGLAALWPRATSGSHLSSRTGDPRRRRLRL